MRFAAGRVDRLMLSADGESWNRAASTVTTDPLAILGAGTITRARDVSRHDSGISLSGIPGAVQSSSAMSRRAALRRISSARQTE